MSAGRWAFRQHFLVGAPPGAPVKTLLLIPAVGGRGARPVPVHSSGGRWGSGAGFPSEMMGLGTERRTMVVLKSQASDSHRFSLRQLNPRNLGCHNPEISSHPAPCLWGQKGRQSGREEDDREPGRLWWAGGQPLLRRHRAQCCQIILIFKEKPRIWIFFLFLHKISQFSKASPSQAKYLLDLWLNRSLSLS